MALGKNFQAHAEEFSEEVPEEPLFFNKVSEGLCGHNHEVSPPAGYADRLDHEVELAVIIATRAENVAPKDSFQHVAGYSVANDLTLRTFQGRDREKQYPWFRSKNFANSCPMGPCFVPENYLNSAELGIRARVNGEVRQEANTRDMVVSVAKAISYLSAHMPLNPGDVILMGTPSGVGPLNDGDVVECEIDGIGCLRNTLRRS
ncbi:MAG: 2-keto-4-pentenoate hydratase/2-oxohepta-3-ene-1,7-dioic acid hydratase in catechol pathway [Candidatus Paceibacteria bacterium]